SLRLLGRSPSTWSWPRPRGFSSSSFPVCAGCGCRAPSPRWPTSTRPASTRWPCSRPWRSASFELDAHIGVEILDLDRAECVRREGGHVPALAVGHRRRADEALEVREAGQAL